MANHNEYSFKTKTAMTLVYIGRLWSFCFKPSCKRLQLSKIYMTKRNEAECMRIKQENNKHIY